MLPDDPLFVHRDNEDGTIVSFCRKCFMTVASSQWEADLERSESSHKCDPFQLESIYTVFSIKYHSNHQQEDR